MKKEHLHFTIWVSCIVAFLFIWLGIIFGRWYQDDIYSDRASRILSEASQQLYKANKKLDSTKTLYKLTRKYVDSITVKEIVYINR